MANGKTIRVSAPGGGTVTFPPGTSEATIAKAMRAKFGGPAAPPTGIGQYAMPIVRGAEHLLGGVGASLFQPVAGAQKMVTGKVSPWLQRASAPPPGVMGKLGDVGGTIGTFMLPGGLEDAAGEGLGDLAEAAGKYGPTLAKYAAPLGRIAMGALDTGALNKLYGGGFWTGAALGGGLDAAGEGIRALAPSMAEGALGIAGKARAYGKTPGETILRETSGLSPAAVEESAQGAKDAVGSALERAYDAATQGGETVSLDKPLRVLDDEIAKFKNARNPGLVDWLKGMRDNLAGDSTEVSPNDAWSMKRALGMMNWNPDVDASYKVALHRRVYGALGEALDDAVPEASDLNQRYSTLRDVTKRAEIESRGPQAPQRFTQLMRRATGRLALPGIIGAETYEHTRSPSEAMLAGILGLGSEQVLGAPSMDMAMARMMNQAPAFARAARSLPASMRNLRVVPTAGPRRK